MTYQATDHSVDTSDLIQNFSVVSYQIETGYRYNVSIFFVNGEIEEGLTDWSIYPSFESALEAGIESINRQCAISQLYDLFYDWLDSGLISDAEFESVESSLNGQIDQRNTIEM